MRGAALSALAEADVVLYLVDGTRGRPRHCPSWLDSSNPSARQSSLPSTRRIFFPVRNAMH